MAGLSEFEDCFRLCREARRHRSLSGLCGNLVTIFPGIDSRAKCAVRRTLYRADADSCVLLEQARRLGTSEHALLAAYPPSEPRTLLNVLAYARSHA